MMCLHDLHVIEHHDAAADCGFLELLERTHGVAHGLNLTGRRVEFVQRAVQFLVEGHVDGIQLLILFFQTEYQGIARMQVVPQPRNLAANLLGSQTQNMNMRMRYCDDEIN